ncbi:MAG: lytic murein transglycosylase [Actinomycetota bacterium]|nr:lytic murein transglycosylase [Actinomycetota bacterium]
MLTASHGFRLPRAGRRARRCGGGAGSDVEQITGPGFAALLRRHPDAARKTAAGAIVGGFALFVAASVTHAGANPVHPAAPAPASAAPTFTVPVDSYNSGGNAAGVNLVPALKPDPKLAAAPAPVDPGVISGLAANGIPTVALNAYRVAAARLGNADPGCGIDWALLAGIGREESDHGRFAGAQLHADGTSTPRIIGIALNGVGTALILDTDHGRLDGDTVYDRAVGPMQFIPSTWAVYGTDADGNGIGDPFNINDAALTAARYLCSAGGDLRTRAGQVAAVLAYNHSDQYLAQVLALADAYRSGVPITGIPVGNVSGALPPVNSHGTPPPANPGAPTANPPSTRAAAHPAASTRYISVRSTSSRRDRAARGAAQADGWRRGGRVGREAARTRLRYAFGRPT